MLRIVCWLCALTLAAGALEAQAYIGPGLGLGTVGAILGLLMSIIVAIFAIIWYPIKRLLKKIRPQTGDTTAPPDTKANSAED